MKIMEYVSIVVLKYKSIKVHKYLFALTIKNTQMF